MSEITKQPVRTWKITQGTSTVTIRAATYQAAVDRAFLVGIKDPDSVVLQDKR